MKNKGQAAMEFLMTYGWAILAAVVVIGVLAAFGVFSPSRYISTTCSIPAPFGCDKNQVAATTSSVSLVIRNGGGTDYVINSVSIEGCGTNSSSATMTDGSTMLWTVPCTSSLTSGQKFKGTVTINYMPSGGQLNQTTTGTIVVKVQ